MKLPRSDCCVEELLERRRMSRQRSMLYGMVWEQCEALVRETSEPLLREMGLPFMDLHLARCCYYEFAKHYHRHLGHPLAEHLAMSVHKYQVLGMRQDVLARLLARIDEAACPAEEAGHAVD